MVLGVVDANTNPIFSRILAICAKLGHEGTTQYMAKQKDSGITKDDVSLTLTDQTILRQIVQIKEYPLGEYNIWP